jgi:hypothetical protein
MVSSDATSENGKKKSLLPNVSFLDEFSQEPYYSYKGTFGKKRKAPNCHNSRKTWLSSPCLNNIKWCHAIQTKVSLGEKMAPIVIIPGENV